ncbi:MAG: HAMP domain-containing histidine kinase [Clostridia bacterium]|nr:HAMP domain-containing histidine kinase [Clostridia bacterium]
MTEQENPELTRFPETALTGMLLLCSASGRILYTSGGLRLLLGEDLSGRNLNDLMEDRAVARLISEVQAGRESTFECTLREHRFSCAASPMEGNIHIELFPLSQKGGVFITMNASRYLSREINRELSLMLPTVQKLEREQSSRETALLKRGIYRFIRLARDLEDCAAAENGYLELYFSDEDLTALCGEISRRIEPLCAEKGIRFTARLPESPLIARVDREKTCRMLLHLISNAMAAQPDGGSIVLTLRQRDGEAVFSVTDAGSGIQSEVMGSVFRKYDELDPLKTGSSGVGFGLALTRAFAEKHGGRFMLMSNEGGGTSAQVALPLEQEHPVDSVHSMRATYGTGLDPVLVELSTVLDAEAFLTKQ